MKKIVLLLTLLVATFTLSAQEELDIDLDFKNPSLYNNRVHFSYGDGFAIWLAKSLNAISSEDIVGDYTGVLTLGYRKSLSDGRWAVGGDFSYVGFIDRSIGGKSNHLYFIMPGIEAYYLRNPHIKLYSSINMGVMVGNFDDYGDVSKVNFMMNVAPIGMKIGSRGIYAFAELGIGYKGVLNVGVEYSF